MGRPVDGAALQLDLSSRCPRRGGTIRQAAPRALRRVLAVDTPRPAVVDGDGVCRSGDARSPLPRRRLSPRSADLLRGRSARALAGSGRRRRRRPVDPQQRRRSAGASHRDGGRSGTTSRRRNGAARGAGGECGPELRGRSGRKTGRLRRARAPSGDRRGATGAGPERGPDAAEPLRRDQRRGDPSRYCRAAGFTLAVLLPLVGSVLH